MRAAIAGVCRRLRFIRRQQQQSVMFWQLAQNTHPDRKMVDTMVFVIKSGRFAFDIRNRSCRQNKRM
jgi:hypothetical protein